jgi:hypothetical protein
MPAGLPDSRYESTRLGDDAICWVADRKRYVGAASLGFGPDGKRLRRVVTGNTKQEVRQSSRHSTTRLPSRCSRRAWSRLTLRWMTG